jgi:hypothetical protein
MLFQMTKSLVNIAHYRRFTELRPLAAARLLVTLMRRSLRQTT